MNAQKRRPPSAAGETESNGQPAVEPDQQPRTLDTCRRCALWQRATQGVPGAGARHAPIMLVGEQPGDSEDLAGKPFVGPAGQLLDDAMHEAGVARKDVFITNAVKHFKWEPRGKRRLHKTPAQREIEACRYWLDQELDEVGPKVVVALGSTALKTLLQDPHARLQEHFGKVIEHGGRAILATWHPSYALRAPDRETRHRALAHIVETLSKAGVLAHGKRSGAD
jgi:DNA polymerase